MSKFERQEISLISEELVDKFINAIKEMQENSLENEKNMFEEREEHRIDMTEEINDLKSEFRRVREEVKNCDDVCSEQYSILIERMYTLMSMLNRLNKRY